MTVVYIGDFPIDAAIDEQHTLSSEVTSSPVEEGADIVDHVRNHPIHISLNCIVSDTPIGELVDVRDLAGGSPSSQAYEHLKEIYEKREPITVTTELWQYDNMIMDSLTIPRSASIGASLSFQVSFQQIEFVTNNRTSIKVSIPRAKKKSNLGLKPAKKEAKPLVGVKINRVIDINTGVND